MFRHVDVIAVLLLALSFVAISNAHRVVVIPPIPAAGFHNAADFPSFAEMDRALADLDSALNSIR